MPLRRLCYFAYAVSLVVAYQSLVLDLCHRKCFNNLSRLRTLSTALQSKGLGSKASDEMFVCQECGHEHIKWMGKCSSCGTWNSVKSFRPARSAFEPTSSRRIIPTSASWVSPPVNPSSTGSSTSSFSSSGAPPRSTTTSGTYNNYDSAAASSSGAYSHSPPTNPSMRAMNTIEVDEQRSRISLFSDELNRVLGGGLVRGSVVLCAGEPGIGKSTLLMQIASHAAIGAGVGAYTEKASDRHERSQHQSHSQSATVPAAPVVYVSGEETAEQLVSRARRLELPTANIYLQCEIDVEIILESILALPMKPALVIVDSVQTMRWSGCTGQAGSVAQIRESAAAFIQLAKTHGVAVVLLGHVTKAGEVAGPRLLEHMVDAVLLMEGSETAELRLLRSVKNRFGSTSEVGVFSMTRKGMEDVSNPSALFLSQSILSEGLEGAAAAVVMQGSRPVIAEIQCLVGAPQFMAGPQQMRSPRRAADGFPLPRLLLLCAVVEKRLKLSLAGRDVYLNVVGGLRVSEPSSDLAVTIAVVSSLTGLRVRPAMAFIGEVGLNGEIRGGRRLEQRVMEASQMGFTTVLVPEGALSSSSKLGGERTSTYVGTARVTPCATLSDVLKLALEGDFEEVLARRRKERSRKKGGAAQANTITVGGSERPLYRPGEAEWMSEESDLIPTYDEYGVVNGAHDDVIGD